MSVAIPIRWINLYHFSAYETLSHSYQEGYCRTLPDFRLMNTRKISTQISCVMPFLSEMSDLILSLPHYNKHSDLCSADNRHSAQF